LQPATSLFIIPNLKDEAIFATIERTLAGSADRRASAALAQLPSLTTVTLDDPYLLEQLSALRQHFELRPQPARSLSERLRTRLAWWLLGGELQHINHIHAHLVRIVDSLLVHLDQERITRRRIERHLSGLYADLLNPSLEVACSAGPSRRASAHKTDALAVVWHSLFAGYSGYSVSSHAFVLGLDARHVAVRPLFIHGGDHDDQAILEELHPRIVELQATPLRLDVPQVVYAAGDRFSKNSGSYRIGFTMLEVDRLPASWVEQANQMDEVWTPTEWGAEVFRASGVQRPVFVVPLGVDNERFQPGTPRTHLRDRTLFLSIFEWGARKGWDVLLRAYCAAFRADDPVLLLLKVDSRELLANPVRELAAILSPAAPPVAVMYNQRLTPGQLLELYRGADCLVQPSRGEGWGMPILEAMACGTPAIATNWSGPTAFLSAQNGYPLPIVGLEPTHSTAPNFRAAQWASPDEAALVDLLRQAAANPTERQRKGMQAAQDAQQWSWQHAIDQVYERLAAI
jgi:glycosyltransferase involved in cell wall biosynthesis